MCMEITSTNPPYIYSTASYWASPSPKTWASRGLQEGGGAWGVGRGAWQASSPLSLTFLGLR